MDKLWWIASGTLITSFVIQIIVIYLSHKHDFFIDSHTDEKPQNFHTFSTPRAGGIGIVVAMLSLLLTPLGWKLFLSVLLAFASGIVEDFHLSVKPKTRLLLQFVAATGAVLLTHSVVTYLGFGIYLPYWLGVVFSIFAIIGMMNAVNIIDGFNGLASGIILLILLSFGLVSDKVGDTQILAIIVVTASAVFGFFLLNFPKGKIFLGDGGAYLLGFMAALTGIFLAGNYEKVSPWFILAVLIYPAWEVLFSVYRKMKAGRSPLEPDPYHMHMLIYRHVTHNNPLTAVVILAGVGPFILLPALYANNSGANFATSLIFIIFYTLLYRYLYRKETARNQEER
ncbi:MAG: glycosyltransferase [Campylobacterota bacterium]|nr:glycosyltransferase [Campylobacterota bacterium]